MRAKRVECKPVSSLSVRRLSLRRSAARFSSPRDEPSPAALRTTGDQLCRPSPQAATVKKLYTWFVELDRILRGQTTRLADLRDGKLAFPLGGLLFVLILLAMLAGICTGSYAVVNHGQPLQMVATAVKVPALFLLTLLVTLPSLYVFNALVGSRLSASSVFRLFVAALAVNVAVLASLGPIVAFFSINTASYAFMVLLNVVVFAFSGVLSLIFLVQTLRRLNTAIRAATPSGASDADDQAAAGGHSEQAPVDKPGSAAEAGPLEQLEDNALGRSVRTVFTLWMIVFGLVGAQMSWILRPFIGSPDRPFQWFRQRQGNFFEAVWQAASSLFG